MARKKRCKFNSGAKDGVARRILQTNFSTLPDMLSSIKNGHVLHVFLSSGSSRAQTERELKSHYPVVVFSSILNSRILSVVSKTLLKFKKLSNLKELELFTAICNATFDPGFLTPASTAEAQLQMPVETGVIDVDQIPSTSTAKGDMVAMAEPHSDGSPTIPLTPHNNIVSVAASISSPIPSTSSTCTVMTRSSATLHTPRKGKLRRRLPLVSAQSAHFKSKLREMSQKLKTQRRAANQALRRKDEQLRKKNQKIRELQRAYAQSNLAKELAAAKAELSKLKQNHQKLKINSSMNNPTAVFKRANGEKVIIECKPENNYTLGESIKFLQEKINSTLTELIQKEDTTSTNSTIGKHSLDEEDSEGDDDDPEIDLKRIKT